MEEVRLDVFGARSAPFEDVSEAVAWIRTESENGNTDVLQQQYGRITAVALDLNRRLLEACSEAKAALEEGRPEESWPPGSTLSVGFEEALVTFWAPPDRCSHSVRATTAILARVSRESAYLAAYMGCKVETATLALLSGVRPQPGVSVRRNLAEGLPGPASMRTLVFASDAPLSAVKRALRSLPDVLSPKELEILDAVEQATAHLGDPPRRAGKQGKDVGLRRYWTGVLERYNKRRNVVLQDGDWSFSDWTGLHRAYERAAKKHVPTL